MPLFRIEKQRVTNVIPKEFSNERELQELFDRNLEDMAGIRVIASWFPIPGGEVDALGIDERNTPVVIEYKWQQDRGAITQGLSYLHWVKQNRKTFELLVKDKLGEGIKVIWDSPRLVIIAKDFTPKDLDAIKEIGRVELKKYSYYGDLINIEDLVPAKPPKVGKVVETPKEAIGPEEEYTIDKLLRKASPELRDLFLTLRGRILKLGDDVWERVWGSYCDYRKSSTFVSPNIQTKRNRLRIFIKMGDKEIDDPNQWATKKDFGFGKLNTRFELESLNQIDYAMHLIRQAYDYVP